MTLCVGLLRMLFPTMLFTAVAFSFVGILQSLEELNVPAAHERGFQRRIDSVIIFL